MGRPPAAEVSICEHIRLGPLVAVLGPARASAEVNGRDPADRVHHLSMLGRQILQPVDGLLIARARLFLLLSVFAGMAHPTLNGS